MDANFALLAGAVRTTVLQSRGPAALIPVLLLTIVLLSFGCHPRPAAIPHSSESAPPPEPTVITEAIDIVPPATEPIEIPSPAEAPPIEALPEPIEALPEPTAPPITGPENPTALSPTDTLIHDGATCLAAGDAACAVAALREAIRLDPTQHRAHDTLGLALAQQGDLDGAAEAFRTTLRLQPGFAPAHLHLGTVLMTRQEWSAAARELDEAIHLEPASAQAHATLGAVRYATGDRGGAIGAYRIATALKPDYPDAHYHLGLLLKLVGKEPEAAAEFTIAAHAGLAMAQYFLASAYAAGAGIDLNLTQAVRWYFEAADQGHTQAKEALSKLRWTAIMDGHRDAARTQEAAHAFEAYRAHLRDEVNVPTPDANSTEAADNINAPLEDRLLRAGRADLAVALLIREASALSVEAQAFLENWYEYGVEGLLPPFDARILTYFQTAAAEGLPQPRRALARILAQGFGVERDLAKATALLKGDQDEAAQQLLKEIAAARHDASRGEPAGPPDSHDRR
jgi:TPR repeat protein